MKALIKISLVFIFLPCVVTSCANALAVDGLTDEAIIAQLGKLNGKEFTKDDVCIKRLKESAKIVVIGVKDNKTICRFDGVFVDSNYFEKGNIEQSKIALRSMEWENSDERTRRKLAKLWVEKVLFAFSAQADRTFQTVSLDNDGIKVIVSLQLPPGITSRNAPKIFVFDKDGNVSSASSY